MGLAKVFSQKNPEAFILLDSQLVEFLFLYRHNTIDVLHCKWYVLRFTTLVKRGGEEMVTKITATLVTLMLGIVANAIYDYIKNYSNRRKG